MEAIIFLYVNGVKIYQSTTKNFEIKPYPLWLGNISKNSMDNNMKKLE